MSDYQTALSIVEELVPPHARHWINPDRRSEDWKTRIYQDNRSGLQFAIYKRKTSMMILLETGVASSASVEELPERPASHSLEKEGSRFGAIRGHCYKTTDATAFKALLCTYLGI